MYINKKNKKNMDKNTSHNSEYSCFDCKHIISTQPDIICYIGCIKTNRDFTFENENTEICKYFEED